MFRKTNRLAKAKFPARLTFRKESPPTVISKDMHLLGDILCDGTVDFDGTLEGNIRCFNLTLRGNGLIKGEIVADTVTIQGRVNGVIRAKNVNLHASCHVEGIIMHETITTEDGAFIAATCKYSDNVYEEDENSAYDDGDADGAVKTLENIRFIG